MKVIQLNQEGVEESFCLSNHKYIIFQRILLEKEV